MKKKTENELIKVKTDSLKMQEPFKSLFSEDTETYKQTYSKVYVNMDLLGFDEAQPIIVWKGRNIVIDGHTRLRVALEKEIKEVSVIKKEFLNEDDAIQYAVHLHRDRRKFTDADIYRLVCKLDDKHPPGRPLKTASVDAVSNPSLFPDFKEYGKDLGILGGIKDKRKTVHLPKTPYPRDGYPVTALNLAIHDRIPSLNDGNEMGGLEVGPQKGGRHSRLGFEGDLREGLAQFKEWAYGRSDDITATLIGTSRTKVDKCRRIRDCKNKDLREDLRDKVLRGKLTINRASSIVKNNGKHRNDPKLEFQKGIVVHSKDQYIDSIDLDSVKWVILGTHGKPPKINDPIPKDSIISPKE
ncbi:MAG: hypothetical protein ABSB10_03455 [Candidatus Bathyarchaeia archaeon]|jgi:hypothetical protein